MIKMLIYPDCMALAQTKKYLYSLGSGVSKERNYIIDIKVVITCLFMFERA